MNRRELEYIAISSPRKRVSGPLECGEMFGSGLEHEAAAMGPIGEGAASDLLDRPAQLAAAEGLLHLVAQHLWRVARASARA
eukprot:scaffold191808_cov36-Tisochrysis_lutea.AAC.1